MKLYNFGNKMHTRLCHENIGRIQDGRMLMTNLTSVIWNIYQNGKIADKY